MSIKSQQPLVSIIMPTYNRARFIAESITSVQQQTYSNWELIIVDDGSDDNTMEVVGSIADQRIIFLEAGRTGVVGHLKNIAIQKASGNLFAFLDSDDLWHPTKLEKQVNALSNDKDAGFCLVNGYNFNQKGEATEYFYKQLEGTKRGNVFLACFQSEVAGYTQALLLRKECVAVSGNFKEDKTFSDAEFIIALAHKFEAVILYEPLVYRRIHESNYIHSNWIKSMNEGIDIICHYKHFLPKEIARQSLFRLHIAFGEKYLKSSRYRQAMIEFNKAWFYNPVNFVPVKKMAKTFVQAIRSL